MGLEDVAGPDTLMIQTEHGGNHSHIPARFDLIDGEAMFKMAQVLHEGAESHGEENWRGVPIKDNLNHALMHIYAYLAKDGSDDHLPHALCRIMFAVAVECQGGPIDVSKIIKGEGQSYPCEWIGGNSSCGLPSFGYVSDDDGVQHPLCWTHLNPELHPHDLRDKLCYPALITNPCGHADHYGGTDGC